MTNKEVYGNILFAADLSKGVGFENPHMFEIVTGVDRYLEEKGYSLILKHVSKHAPEDKKAESSDSIVLHYSGTAGERFNLIDQVLTKIHLGKHFFKKGLF